MFKIKNENRFLCILEAYDFHRNNHFIGAIKQEQFAQEASQVIFGPHTWDTPEQHLEHLKNTFPKSKNFAKFNWEDVEIVKFKMAP